MKLNRKNKFLLVGFIAALYICYKFAIANTLHYYQEYTAKKELTSAGYNTPELAVQLKQKEKQLDILLNATPIPYLYRVYTIFLFCLFFGSHCTLVRELFAKKPFLRSCCERVSNMTRTKPL